MAANIASKATPCENAVLLRDVAIMRRKQKSLSGSFAPFTCGHMDTVLAAVLKGV